MPAPLMRSIPEPELLPEVRYLLNRCPELVEHPECLTTSTTASEYEILAVLEALSVEGEVLA
jgi:hypothetical protein